MKRQWIANAAVGAPPAPVSPSIGYPQEGASPTIPGAYFYHSVMEELIAVIVAGGLTPDANTLTQLRDAILVLAAAAKPRMIVSDQKSSGTHGGASASGVNTRVLNTVEANGIAGASLASNQITLPAGTYCVMGFVPGGNVGPHRARLYNVTDAANTILGSSENASSSGTGDLINTNSVLAGRFTIAATKVFEVRHYCSAAESTWGLGNAVGEASINEVYSRIEITKEA